LGVPPKEVDLFRRAIDGLHLSDAEDSQRWKNTFDSRICDGALNALLMLHTPNVTSITIDGYCPWWSPSDAHEEQPWNWWEAAIPRRDNFFTMKSPQPLSRLKEIRMYEAITMVQLASVMRLPALEKLMIWHLTNGTTSLSEATPDQWSPAMFPQGSTRIRFLELSGEPVHEDVLSTLIDACQKLEFFSYSQCSDQGGMYSDVGVSKRRLSFRRG
jgi:hypothetical protein